MQAIRPALVDFSVLNATILTFVCSPFFNPWRIIRLFAEMRIPIHRIRISATLIQWNIAKAIALTIESDVLNSTRFDGPLGLIISGNF